MDGKVAEGHTVLVEDQKNDGLEDSNVVVGNVVGDADIVVQNRQA